MTRNLLVLFLGIIALAFAGCGDKTPPQAEKEAGEAGGGKPGDEGAEELSGSLKVIGSNTVTPVSTAWAEGFMKLNPKVNVSISGPGSGPGIAAIIDGTTDIGQSSRAIRPAEIEKAKAKGHEVVETIIAWDGLAMVVSNDNPVNELTLDQIAGIYLGGITNWKDVGGNDARIVAISRDTASGTHSFFKEFVLKDAEFTQSALFLPSTSTGVTETARNPNAVFYAGLGYVTSEVKVLGVKKDADSPAVKPGIPTVNDKSYPLARPLFYYTNGEPAGLAKAFIEYGLSPAGAALVEKLGFVPLP